MEHDMELLQNVAVFYQLSNDRAQRLIEDLYISKPQEYQKLKEQLHIVRKEARKMAKMVKSDRQLMEDQIMDAAWNEPVMLELEMMQMLRDRLLNN